MFKRDDRWRQIDVCKTWNATKKETKGSTNGQVDIYRVSGKASR